MGTVAKGKEVLSTGVTLKVRAYLLGRSARIGESMSWVIAGAVDHWLACGAPPLSLADKHTPIAPELVELLDELRTHSDVAALVMEGAKGADATLLKDARRKVAQKAALPDEYETRPRPRRAPRT